MEQKKSITARYAGVHGFFWAALCPIVTFAAVYLQGKGYRTSEIGVLLALITIVSALIQPVLASAVDRSTRVSLRSYLLLIAGLALLGVCAMSFFRFTGSALLMTFFVASILVHLLEPLINSVADYCQHHGIPLNFGISRAVGTLLFALTSFGVGYAADLCGVDSLMLVCAAFLALLLCALFLLPRMRPGGAVRQNTQPCSLPQFLHRYGRYTLVLVGFFFVATFHMMTETYLINMMERVGGGSSSVGTALLIANIAEFFAILFYDRFRRLLSTCGWLKVTAVCFVVKALLFHLASSVMFVYLAQLLQAVTYGLYAPSIVLFSSEEIAESDMVKGQSVSVAIFTLGTSLGNYLGGRLIQNFSVRAMTFTGFLFACVGAAIVMLVLRKKQPASRRTV
ncbi:MAG: MFS transporter [Oscillospiraceae bacterium]|nr:MFS transporter [Oscillospiraceae bacterium]